MLNFKQLEEEWNRTRNVDFETKPPYGIYKAKIINMERREEPDKNRERIRITYKIIEGEYQNVGLRDNYYLSENSSRSTQLFQYNNIKMFFQTIAPKIQWDFENIEHLAQHLPLYLEETQKYEYTIHYRQDNNGFDRIYIQSQEEVSIPKIETMEEIPDIYMSSFPSEGEE